MAIGVCVGSGAERDGGRQRAEEREAPGAQQVQPAIPGHLRCTRRSKAKDRPMAMSAGGDRVGVAARVVRRRRSAMRIATAGGGA
ncbi:MAG: hypothetical protein AAF192_23570, partial [Pseudomonadota bacterium]